MPLNIFKKREISTNNWYAVFVETGEEEKVRERLKYRFEEKYKIIVPKRKLRERSKGVWVERIRILFPGYVLVNGYIKSEDIIKFKDIPGLLKLLKSGYEPLTIEAYEIELINSMMSYDETIGLSEVLFENGRVVVVDGPLLNFEGHIKSIDRRKGRAKVKLNFLGEDRVVELGINVLRPE